MSSWELSDGMEGPSVPLDGDDVRREGPSRNEGVSDAGEAVIEDGESKPCAVHEGAGQHAGTAGVGVVEGVFKHGNHLKGAWVNNMSRSEDRFDGGPETFYETCEQIHGTLEQVRNDLW